MRFHKTWRIKFHWIIAYQFCDHKESRNSCTQFDDDRSFAQRSVINLHDNGTPYLVCNHVVCILKMVGSFSRLMGLRQFVPFLRIVERSFYSCALKSWIACTSGLVTANIVCGTLSSHQRSIWSGMPSRSPGPSEKFENSGTSCTKSQLDSLYSQHQYLKLSTITFITSNAPLVCRWCMSSSSDVLCTILKASTTTWAWPETLNL